MRGLITAGTIADTTQVGALSVPHILFVFPAHPLWSSLAPMAYGMDARRCAAHTMPRVPHDKAAFLCVSFAWLLSNWLWHGVRQRHTMQLCCKPNLRTRLAHQVVR